MKRRSSQSKFASCAVVKLRKPANVQVQKFRFARIRNVMTPAIPVQHSNQLSYFCERCLIYPHCNIPYKPCYDLFKSYGLQTYIWSIKSCLWSTTCILLVGLIGYFHTLFVDLYRSYRLHTVPWCNNIMRCMLLMCSETVLFFIIVFDCNVLAKTCRNLNFKIRPKKTLANYFKFSFFNRYITDWNSIPSNIMHTPSLSSFKSYLSDHLCQF